jgi:hypothetical protein
MHPNFAAMYPLSTHLGLVPVSTGKEVEHAGFDIDEVEKALRPERFQKFAATLKRVFSCGHRNWPADHRPDEHPEAYKNNCEVHCVYAEDLEDFLASERAQRKVGQ